jgi:hypothetical protein
MDEILWLSQCRMAAGLAESSARRDGLKQARNSTT